MDKLEELLRDSKESVLHHQLKLSKPVIKRVHPPKNKKRTVAVGGVVVAGALLLAGFTNPQLFHIGKTFNLLTSRFFSTPDITEAVQLGFGQKVNQTATDQGISLVIGNVYADATKLEFDMVESFGSGRILDRPAIQDENMHLDINGSRKLYGFSGGEFRQVSGGKYAGVVYFPVMNDQPYTSLPTKFTLNVHVNQIGDVKGNWKFSIPVSWEKMNSETKEFQPQVQVSDQGDTLQVNTVSVGPTQTMIQCRMTVPENGRLPDMMQIVDDRGNQIGGSVATSTEAKLPSGRKQFTFIVTGGAPAKGSKQLYLTPMFMSPGPMPSVSIKGPLPETLTIKPGLEVSVTGVEFHSNEVLVHLDLNGAKYKQETTYRGHDLFGQYVLVANTSKASYGVGSKSINISPKNPNQAVVVFDNVDTSKKWRFGGECMTVESGLTLSVPLQ